MTKLFENVNFINFLDINEEVGYFINLNNCIYENYILEESEAKLRRKFRTERSQSPWKTYIGDFFSKNPKTMKSDAFRSNSEHEGINQEVLDKTLRGSKGYQSFLIHLTPSAQSGFVTCPLASLGCASSCLQTSGNIGALADKTGARLKKTWYLAKEMPHVISNMIDYISKLKKKVESEGDKLVIRLNGTSDLSWEDLADEKGRNLMSVFPDINFYDYTKIKNRIGKTPSNYHLTFSRSEKNDKEAVELLNQGYNVAVVFGPGKIASRENVTFPDKKTPLLPKVWNGFRVISGDKHDLRFLEQQPNKSKGIVIGLISKGAATFESYDSSAMQFLGKSGFVVQPNDPSVTAYPENKQFIEEANKLIKKRNEGKSNVSGQFSKAKQRYKDEQRIISGLMTGMLRKDELEKLANEPRYKRLIGTFKQIEDYCKKFPSKCSKDYMTAMSGKPQQNQTDVAGEKIYMPQPYDLSTLKKIGLVSGNRSKLEPPDNLESPEEEEEFQKWKGAQSL